MTSKPGIRTMMALFRAGGILPDMKKACTKECCGSSLEFSEDGDRSSRKRGPGSGNDLTTFRMIKPEGFKGESPFTFCSRRHKQ